MSSATSLRPPLSGPLHDALLHLLYDHLYPRTPLFPLGTNPIGPALHALLDTHGEAALNPPSPIALKEVTPAGKINRAPFNRALRKIHELGEREREERREGDRALVRGWVTGLDARGQREVREVLGEMLEGDQVGFAGW